MAKITKTLCYLLILFSFSILKSQQRIPNQCIDKEKKNQLLARELILALNTKNLQNIEKYFNSELYFLDYKNNQEAAFFKNGGDNFGFGKNDFKNLILDTKNFQIKFANLFSLHEVFTDDNSINIKEYQNYCDAGERNMDKKGNYIDTMAIIAKYQGVSYNLIYITKNKSFEIRSIYFFPLK